MGVCIGGFLGIYLLVGWSYIGIVFIFLVEEKVEYFGGLVDIFGGF